MGEVFKENLDNGLFDNMGESLVLLLKQQAVYEFFATNDVACPHCNHDLDVNDLMDLDRTSTGTGDTPQSNLEITDDEINEAKELLNQVSSWTEQEIETLPDPQQSKVKEYQQLYSRLTE